MNEYPTESQLKVIRNWYKRDSQPVIDLIDFIGALWWMPDWGFKLTGKRVLRLELHTGGWSGNEDIINELHNTMFWMLYWRKSIRGGHYYFKIKPLKKS